MWVIVLEIRTQTFEMLKSTVVAVNKLLTKMKNSYMLLSLLPVFSWRGVGLPPTQLHQLPMLKSCTWLSVNTEQCSKYKQTVHRPNQHLLSKAHYNRCACKC
jgi:hypothetical protein